MVHSKGEEGQKQDNNEGGGVEVFVDDSFGFFAEEVEEEAFGAETHRAKDCANDDEFEKRDVGHTANPAKNHIGDGGKGGDGNSPEVVFLIKLKRLLCLLAEVDGAEADLLEESDDTLRTDGQAEGKGDCAAEDGKEGADHCIPYRTFWFAERHTYDHQVGGNRDANRLDNGNEDKHGHTVASMRPVHNPVVEAAVEVPPGGLRVLRAA